MVDCLYLLLEGKKGGRKEEKKEGIKVIEVLSDLVLECVPNTLNGKICFPFS